jgi:hypothetical protein
MMELSKAKTITKGKKHSDYFEQFTIFKEINLNDIFSDGDVEDMLNDPLFNTRLKKDMNSSFDSTTPVKRSSLYMYDRTTLMNKLLTYAIDKLKSSKEKAAMNGLAWYIH